MDIEEQYDKIYRYCYFKLGQRAIAEDITQETFLRFLENDTYKNQGKSLHYLYTIARNLCIDEYRKNGRENKIENTFRDTETDINIENISVADSVHNKIVNSSKTEDQVITTIVLQQALAELSEQDRELVLLRYVNELPMFVISKLLGISRFAIYRRLNNALNQLKYKLGEED